MEFRIQAKVCPLIITDEPILLNGERKDGLADWDNKRILIGSHVPPTERLGVLLHEVWHCWRFQCPGATEIEAECEMFAMVAEVVIEDIEDQGGVRALTKLRAGDEQPAGAADPAVEPPDWGPQNLSRLELLRRTRFHHVETEEQWQSVLAECREAGIDPADAWVKMEVNEETGEVEARVIHTFDTLATIAHRTGKLVDVGLPEFQLPDGTWTKYWSLPDPPAVARAYVTRSDYPTPFEGIAFLERSMRFIKDAATGEERPARGWRPGSEAGQLGKCARVFAIKNAFKFELRRKTTRNDDDPKGEPRSLPPAGDYGGGRRVAARSPRRAGHGGTPTLASMAAEMLDPPDDPQWAARFINDGTPDSRRGLLLELVNRRNYGMADANALVDRMGEKFKRIAAANYQAFAATVLKIV